MPAAPPSTASTASPAAGPDPADTVRARPDPAAPYAAAPYLAAADPAAADRAAPGPPPGSTAGPPQGSTAGSTAGKRRAREAELLSAPARRELAAIGWGLAASLGLGILVGLPALLPFGFVLGYLVWLLLRIDAALRWLRSGAKARNAPPSSGVTDAVIELVHREKKYSRKQKNRYRSALAQFDRLAAELPDATIVLDAQRQIHWANPAARDILGVMPERDRGQRFDNLVRSPEMRAFLDDPDNDTLGDVEIDSPHRPGRTLGLRLVHSSKKLSVLIARDVTQRVRVRDMRSAFVADVSHELRTPLTVINGYLEMLDDDARLPADALDALARVRTQSQRMQDIVENLLELSKLESNPLDDDEGDEVAVPDMVRELVATLIEGDREAARQRHALHLDESLHLRGSRHEIYSACQNLLVNAARYAGAGATVTIEWGVGEDGSARFAVTDDGPGIEARHLARLSERFYRVDRGRSRERGGTGLGLAIVKHVVQRHGGALDIRSVPGRGATFRLDFPGSRGVPAGVGPGPSRDADTAAAPT